MVLRFYNLAEQPFGVTPDPRFLYLSPSHREALAALQYSLTASRGFTALISEPGMGKTTIMVDFLEKTRHSTRSTFLFQSQFTPRDLLSNLLDDLGVQHNSENLGRMQQILNEYLVQEANSGKRVVIVVDEAQNLGEDVLEFVRTLSNFETPRAKLLHVVLSEPVQSSGMQLRGLSEATD